MAAMPDSSIDLIVTSPPYYLNKEYERTITYAAYCSLLERCFTEWNRILKPGCYLVVNFGDYYNSGNRFYRSDIPACYPASINYYRWGVELAGMDLQATRIWRKRFARMGIPFVCNTHPRPVFDYEHIWTFRKKNGSNLEYVTDRKLSQRGVVGEDWSSSARINKHCAAFPIELPKWAIGVYSRNNTDIVYDPFMGSGTTAQACKEMDRLYIGSETNKEYYINSLERIS
jgi:site-specific DNA-methyltransferase (adenine-specific)